MALEIRLLTQSDDCSGFCCGTPALDNYVRSIAKQHQRKRISGTYLALSEGGIVGFATVLPSEIGGAALADLVRRGLPTHQIPVLRFARLATAKKQQRSPERVGERLLRFVLLLAVDLAERFGCVGVLTDAKIETGAVEFYRKYSFQQVPTEAPDPGRVSMFLSISQIETLLR